MTPYLNLSGDAGVVSYRIAKGSIIVTFKSGDTYLYNDESAGAENIQTMQRLAADGRGLSTFINQVVKNRYAAKL